MAAPAVTHQEIAFEIADVKNQKVIVYDLGDDFGENMDLEPDFEKRVLEGSVYVKGRLRTVHMAVFAAKMLLDKNIRSTYHDIREFKW